MRVIAAFLRNLRRSRWEAPEPEAELWIDGDSIEANLTWAAIDGVMGLVGHVDGASHQDGQSAEIWMADGSIYLLTVAAAGRRWDLGPMRTIPFTHDRARERAGKAVEIGVSPRLDNYGGHSGRPQPKDRQNGVEYRTVRA